MNVCILTWEYPPRIMGGLSKHCHSLSNSLVKNGWNPCIVTLAHPDEPGYSERNDVRIIRIDPPIYSDFLTLTLLYNNTMVKTAIRLHEEERFDLIHAHDWMTFVAGSTLKHVLGIPMIVTFHSTERGRRGGIPSTFEKMINDIEWLGSYEASRVIAVSNAVKVELTGQLNVPGDKISVIHNGMDPEQVTTRNSYIRNFFAASYEKIVLFVGRLVSEKGVEYLLEAGPSILKEHPEAKIVIVGGGEMREFLNQRASTLGISQKVYTTGYVNDELLHALYSCADILVVPSLYEPFGLTVLEGMAAGVPVIASSIGGLSEIIRDGKDGILVPSGDSKSIATAVSRLLSDSNFANKISFNGKARARFFASNIMAEETAKVYEMALGVDTRKQPAAEVGEIHLEKSHNSESKRGKLLFVDR